MSTYNRVLILGTLGQNPTLKNTQTGKPFCRLSLATDSFIPSALDKKKTSWHHVHVFGKSAENAAKYLRKGRQVFVEGRMESDQHEENGERRWKTWITADRVTFLNGGKGSDDFSLNQAGTHESSDEDFEPQFPLESQGLLPH